MEEGSGSSSPPTPEEIAYRLIGAEVEGNQGVDALIAQAEQAFERLHATLALFLGAKGFDSLWTRAMRLARQTPHTEALADEAARLSAPERWAEAASTQDVAEARTLVHAQFASFISLLFTFIGEELGWRLIRPAVPNLPAPEEDTPTEDASS